MKCGKSNMETSRIETEENQILKELTRLHERMDASGKTVVIGCRQK